MAEKNKNGISVTPKKELVREKKKDIKSRATRARNKNAYADRHTLIKLEGKVLLVEERKNIKATTENNV